MIKSFLEFESVYVRGKGHRLYHLCMPPKDLDLVATLINLEHEHSARYADCLEIQIESSENFWKGVVFNCLLEVVVNISGSPHPDDCRVYERFTVTTVNHEKCTIRFTRVPSMFAPINMFDYTNKETNRYFRVKTNYITDLEFISKGSKLITVTVNRNYKDMRDFLNDKDGPCFDTLRLRIPNSRILEDIVLLPRYIRLYLECHHTTTVDIFSNKIKGCNWLTELYVKVTVSQHVQRAEDADAYGITANIYDRLVQVAEQLPKFERFTSLGGYWYPTHLVNMYFKERKADTEALLAMMTGVTKQPKSILYGLPTDIIRRTKDFFCKIERPYPKCVGVEMNNERTKFWRSSPPTNEE